MNNTIIEMSESEWIAKYQPTEVLDGIPSGGWTDEDGNDTLFETYGESSTFLSKQDSNYIWTLIEEDGNMFIIEGCHFVNRMGYFLTEKPHNAAQHLIELEQ